MGNPHSSTNGKTKKNNNSSRINTNLRHPLMNQIQETQSNQNNLSSRSDQQNSNNYTQAVQDFISKQEFKQLAREKNINLSGKLIKSRVGIDMNSIKLIQDSDDRNFFSLSLQYSSTEKAKISIYFGATQFLNSEGVPNCFTIPSNLPPATIVEVNKGNNISLPNVDDVLLDIEQYEGMPLFNYTDNYYPCVIMIESNKKLTVDKDGVSDYQTHIIYGVFRIDKNTNSLQIAPIKQVLVAFEMGFLLQQIYGINDALEENKGNEELKLLVGPEDSALEDEQIGVICMSEMKNTVVMPGGHLGVGRDCAVATSKQRSPDGPIGRKKVKSFVPLNISTIKKIDQTNLKTQGTMKASQNDGDYDYGFEVDDN